MFFPGCLPVLFIFLLLLLLPFFFTQMMFAALTKLGLAPGPALIVLLGIFLGGSINIPVKKIERAEMNVSDPLALFGLGQLFPRYRVSRRYTVIAVNVGGCVIPSLIAAYETGRVWRESPHAFFVLLLVVILSIAVCYRLARPVPGLGIAMPALIPPLVVALVSLVLMPDFAPPIAFVGGVIGPVVGADLLHLKEIKNVSTGMASIGGAGTFDGIVLSGLIAVLLA